MARTPGKYWPSFPPFAGPRGDRSAQTWPAFRARSPFWSVDVVCLAKAAQDERGEDEREGTLDGLLVLASRSDCCVRVVRTILHGQTPIPATVGWFDLPGTRGAPVLAKEFFYK
jgi:hypothetical protein